MNNPYKVLGVSSLETFNNIKLRYRQLARVYHPDNSDTGDAKKFKEVQEAWEYIEKFHPKDSGRARQMWCHKTLFTLKRRNL